MLNKIKKSTIRILSLILMGFIVNNIFLFKMNNIIIKNNIIKNYKLVDLTKQWNRSSRYDIYIIFNNKRYTISIDSHMYGKVINENLQPVVYYDYRSDKCYTKHSLNLYLRMNYFIVFLFVFFSAYYFYYYKKLR